MGARIFWRDFAFEDSRKRRLMAYGSVGDLSAKSFAELLSGPMLDIYVGEERKHWKLHHNLLCHHSELLESELSGDGDKTSDKLELPDHSPAGFELLVKWLYQGKLDDASDLADANQKYEYAVSCHKLYLLCERFDMPQLKNVAIDQHRKALNEAELVPDPDELGEIYRESPKASPFRKLMAKIAARQIMDPSQDKDVEDYRECLQHEPDFAIDLVKAIKNGTGGMLIDDPTDLGNECDYHDHTAGPNCHIKGKGKVKQALKTSTLHPDPIFASAPSRSSAPALPHLHPSPLPNRNRNPKPKSEPRQTPPLQARPQSGTNAGPLRRRITSPASSTLSLSKENASASPPSPKESRDKFRKVTPPERRLPTAPEENSTHPAPDDRPQSSEGESRPLQDSVMSDRSEQSDKSGNTSKSTESDSSAYKTANSSQSIKKNKAEASPETEISAEDTSPRRRLWQWARVGTGRLGIPRPQTEWRLPGVMTSKAATSAVNGALEGGRVPNTSAPSNGIGSLDDFDVPSSRMTEPDNEELNDENLAAKLEGLGIANTTIDPSFFSQTKRSSDDLIADMSVSSINGTPSPHALRSRGSPGMDSHGDLSPPATPSPQPRNEQGDVTPTSKRLDATNEGTPKATEPLPEGAEPAAKEVPEPEAEDAESLLKKTPSPYRIPKYKIALASHILSPARKVSAS